MISYSTLPPFKFTQRFPAFPFTYNLINHYDHSLSVDTTIMVSKKFLNDVTQLNVSFST